MQQPDQIDLKVATRLRERRLTLGLESALLDAMIGVTSGTVAKFESGARRIGAAQLYRLGCALGVEVAYFFADAESETAPVSDDVGGDDARRAREARRFVQTVRAIPGAGVQKTVQALVKTVADQADAACESGSQTARRSRS